MIHEPLRTAIHFHTDWQSPKRPVAIIMIYIYIILTSYIYNSN